MRRVVALAGLSSWLLLVVLTTADAHRFGCHRWHSCPSDRGTYVCGDLGHCSGCPDNQYCLAGQARTQAPSAPPAAGTRPGVVPQDAWT